MQIEKLNQLKEKFRTLSSIEEINNSGIEVCRLIDEDVVSTEELLELRTIVIKSASKLEEFVKLILNNNLDYKIENPRSRFDRLWFQGKIHNYAKSDLVFS